MVRVFPGAYSKIDRKASPIGLGLGLRLSYGYIQDPRFLIQISLKDKYESSALSFKL